jgi:hypothetical protein
VRAPRWILVGAVVGTILVSGLGGRAGADAAAAAPPGTAVVAPGETTTGSDASTSTTSTTIVATGENTGLGPEISVPFQSPPLISEQQVVSGPLVAVPSGCPTVPTATAVFVGTIEAMDFRTAQFVVKRVLAGSLDKWAVNGHVQVRYDDETRFLEQGHTYIVGTTSDGTTGLLTSKVREPSPLFGGDAVIGVNDSGVACAAVEDPVQTLTESGTTVDSGLLTPLKHSKGALISAVLRPLAVAFVVLLLLVLVKQLMFATGRSLRSLTVTEQPLVRQRRSRRTVRRKRVGRSGLGQQPGT